MILRLSTFLKVKKKEVFVISRDPQNKYIHELRNVNLATLISNESLNPSPYLG